MTIKFDWGSDKLNVHFFSKEGGFNPDTGRPYPEHDETFTGVSFADIPTDRVWKITFTPIEGYFITGVSGYVSSEGRPWQMYATINEDGSELLISETPELYTNESITINIDIDDTGFNVKPFNYLYAVDTDILTSLNSERFAQTVDEMVLDSFTNYIINVIELPFRLHDDILEDSSKIVVGRYRSETSATRINTDSVHVNVGEIVVPKIYNNSMDYLNTTAYIYLPYMERVELDLHYCIGETISIEYIISLYDGTVTCNLTSSKINGVFMSKQFKVGRTIPFVIKEGGVQGDLMTQTEGLNNGIITPIIEIVRNNKFETDSPYIQDVIDYVTLQDCSGFVKVERVDLVCSGTSSERNSIIQLLEGGVIIK